MEFLALIIAASTLIASAVALVLALVVASIHREDRHMSLKEAPATRLEGAARRLLGVGVRQPDDSTRRIPAGRR
jgi:hypothetical protein